MRKPAILLLAVFFIGCVTPPQTTRELREGVLRGAMMTKLEEEEVSRPFPETFNSIQKNADRCLNVTVTGSTPGRYGPMVESVPYRSGTRMTGEETAEMVLQQGKQATGKMPEGGYFVILTDIERISAGKTRVTVYGPSMGYNNVFESIFAWAKGETRECPRFPMGGMGQSFRYHNPQD